MILYQLLSDGVAGLSLHNSQFCYRRTKLVHFAR